MKFSWNSKIKSIINYSQLYFNIQLRTKTYTMAAFHEWNWWLNLFYSLERRISKVNALKGPSKPPWKSLCVNWLTEVLLSEKRNWKCKSKTLGKIQYNMCLREWLFVLVIVVYMHSNMLIFVCVLLYIFKCFVLIIYHHLYF